MSYFEEPETDDFAYKQEEEAGPDQQITREQVLSEAKSLPFDDPSSEACSQFTKKYHGWFQAEKQRSGGQDNILHSLVQSSKLQWEEAQIAIFLKWILKRYPELLRLSSGAVTPLQSAIQKRNTAFVEAVLYDQDMSIKDSILEQIYVNATVANNYLHICARQKLIYFSMVADVYKGTKLWTQVDMPHERTPLHTAVLGVHPFFPQIREEKERSRVSSILRGILLGEEVSSELKTEFAGDAVITKWVPDTLEQRRKAKQDREGARPYELTVHDTPGGRVVAPNGTSTAGHNILRSVSHEELAKLLISLILDYQAMGVENRQGVPQQQADSSVPQVSIVDICLSRDRDTFTTLRMKTTGKRTPYQERLFAIRGAWESLNKFLGEIIQIGTTRDPEKPYQDALRTAIIMDPVASRIRSFCIHNCTRDEIVECLYEPGEERHIEFDLAGLPNRSISQSFLERIGKHLQFESVLKYVALPQPFQLKDGQDNDLSIAARQRAFTDLRPVFHWLRSKGVQTIIKAIVVDYEASHSDEVVEQAIGGFGIEEWDWKKVDLCTDVIATCSKNIKSVSLYSSGNNAVLKGWASSQGLADREKFPQLRHVRLFIQLGKESATRRDQKVRAFRDMIERIPAPGGRHVTVEISKDDGYLSYAQGFINHYGDTAKQASWISALEEFGKILLNLRSDKKASVKIAVIDDGVDDSSPEVSEKIAMGKSFCPYSPSADLMNAYYVPSGRHGTMMAELISKICPKCQLYIARLDERANRQNTSRQITIASATQAIRWAVSCGVDIISISWTIEASKDNNRDDIDALHAEITRASAANILIFCSTNDQGNLSTEDCLPRPDGVIRIGAATSTGEKCSWVAESKVDYLLPGQNILFQTSLIDGAIGPTSYESGSSFATALASGLGGLLVLCDRIVGDQTQRFNTKEKMKKAFSVMASVSVGQKYPRADTFFTETFEKWLEIATKNAAITIVGPASEAPGDEAPDVPLFSKLSRRPTGGQTNRTEHGADRPTVSQPNLRKGIGSRRLKDEIALDALKCLLDNIQGGVLTPVVSGDSVRPRRES